MKNKKTKNKNRDKMKVSVCYDVSVPEKDLKTLIESNAAEELKDFCSIVSGIKKHGELPDCFINEINEFADVLMSAADIIEVVQEVWKDALQNQAKKNSPPNKTKKEEKKMKAVKAPILTNKEKAEIERLRKAGFPIKEIGKSIHRAEKVVSTYVHKIESKKKKKH